MVNMFAAFGLGALVALLPLAALAQTDGTAQPMQVAQAAPAASFGPRRRRRVAQKAFAPQRNTRQGEGKGGRRHMRQMRTGTAPKS